MGLHAAVVLLAWVVPTVLSICRDLDPASCPSIEKQNPNLCNDPSLSTIACPRYCKKCPLLCYDCVLAGTNTTIPMCVKTKQCQSGEQCMIRRLMSSTDGHMETVMQCASLQVCDMTVGFVGKRDVSIHCCADDLCNTNSQPTTEPTTTTTRSTTTTATTTSSSTTRTTTPTTTTTTMTTTTTRPIPKCFQDITILIEDYGQRSSLQEWALTDFIKDIVSDLDIGRYQNMVSMALFDDDINKVWNFGSDKAYDKTQLMNDIDNLPFKFDYNDIDYRNVNEFLHKQSNKTFAKSRGAFKDVVIIFADNDNTRLQFRGKSYDFDKIIFVSLRINAYIGSFHTLSQYPQHVFTVLDYNAISTIKYDLLSALCDQNFRRRND